MQKGGRNTTGLRGAAESVGTDHPEVARQGDYDLTAPLGLMPLL